MPRVSGGLPRPRVTWEKEADLRGWTGPPQANRVAREGGEMAEFWGATTTPMSREWPWVTSCGHLSRG